MFEVSEGSPRQGRFFAFDLTSKYQSVNIMSDTKSSLPTVTPNPTTPPAPVRPPPPEVAAAPAAPPPPLPSTREQPIQKTFSAPALLLGMEFDKGGFLTITVRNARTMQLTGRLVSTATEKPPEDETAKVFRVQAENTINFGGGVLSVLTDEVRVGDIHLPATTPSASEYREAIGKEVMIYCKPRVSHRQETAIAGREYFVTDRLFVTLP